TYNGEYDENFIPPIKDGAKEFLLNLSANYKINIFTTRNLLLTSKWLNENDLNEFIDDITNIKKPSYLIIDDRCINFDGNYDDLIDKISHFKVWYK
ncbi:hypothetical protein J6N69_02240, partial [bacterium]|nr:hypothetical protein [bacterium]